MILPQELIRARRSKASITPLYATEEKVSLAKTLIAVYMDNVDKHRSDLDNALTSCEELGYDYKLVRGLSAVLDSMCIFGTRSFIPPAKVREMLFEEAARMVVFDSVTRNSVIQGVASALKVEPKDVEDSMYSDLAEEQQLMDFREPAPTELLQRYNYSLIAAILAYSRRIAFSAKGRNEGLVKAAEGLGETKTKVSGTTAGTIALKPVKQFGSRGARVEALISRLINAKEWQIRADVGYPPRYRETRLLEVGENTHGRLLRADTPPEETVIEIEQPIRKSSFGEIIVIDDVLYKYGLTESELQSKIRSEKVRYVRLPGVLITQDKLDELRDGLKEIEGDDLTDFKDVLKSHGCRNPLPVIEALGYIVEPDPETRQMKVHRLRKASS